MSETIFEAPYRYSVKCDRARNLKIEIAAKAAGLTPTAFVQRHFDAIFDKPAAGAGRIQGDAERREIAAMCEKLGLLPSRQHMYCAFRAEANEQGEVLGTLFDIGARHGIARSIAYAATPDLLSAGLVEVIKAGRGATPNLWRVYSAPVAEAVA